MLTLQTHHSTQNIFIAQNIHQQILSHLQKIQLRCWPFPTLEKFIRLSYFSSANIFFCHTKPPHFYLFICASQTILDLKERAFVFFMAISMKPTIVPVSCRGSINTEWMDEVIEHKVLSHKSVLVMDTEVPLSSSSLSPSSSSLLPSLPPATPSPFDR